MDAKKKLFCILLFRAFKHVDSHIQYLSDKEAQKKRYNDLTNVSYNRLQMSCHVSASYDFNMATSPAFQVDLRRHSCEFSKLEKYNNNSNST